MLKLSRQQLHAFGQVSAATFELDMERHAKRFFPGHFQYLGVEGVRMVARQCITLAGRYGFVRRRDLCLYFNLMLTFGSYFDTDPQLPWVEAVLGDEQRREPSVCADRLTRAALDYMDSIRGPQGAYLQRADASMKQELPTMLRELNAASGRLEDFILAALQRIYPKKYQLAGEAAMRQVIKDGVWVASRKAFVDDRYTAMFIVATFLLGHRFHEDLQCSWATFILENYRLEQGARIEQFQRETMSFLVHRFS